MTGDEPSIELIFFEGCPHAGRARVNLRAALERTRLAHAWTEFDLESSDVPKRLRSHASPTVLVNGRDVTGASGPSRPGAGALACRSDGAPSTDDIVRAIEARVTGDED